LIDYREAWAQAHQLATEWFDEHLKNNRGNVNCGLAGLGCAHRDNRSDYFAACRAEFAIYFSIDSN